MEPQPVHEPAYVAGSGTNSAPTAAELEAKARRQSDGADMPVLPDCCNTGVALRIALAANLVLLMFSLASSANLMGVWQRLQIGAALLEPTLILTLIILCALRNWANQKSLTLQWMVAGLVPACIVVLILGGVQAFLPRLAEEGIFWIWSRAVIAGLVSLAVTQYFRYRTRARAPSMSEARLQALQARIRPHFLFNSLNTVLGLMRSDPRRAETTLENLAELFRVFMRDTRELVPLADELETCRQYLFIEQLRLGDRLSLEWDIEDAPGDALLPSLLLQPLVENAVHHGVEPSSKPGLVYIKITTPAERVRVEIRNPINPEPATRRGNQMALSNVRERLRLLYDIEAELKTTADEQTFTVIVEFPYRRERRQRHGRPKHNSNS
jgi:two-component system, LytTR family, sensor histidine kinase AlgZ